MYSMCVCMNVCMHECVRAIAVCRSCLLGQFLCAELLQPLTASAEPTYLDDENTHGDSAKKDIVVFDPVENCVCTAACPDYS